MSHHPEQQPGKLSSVHLDDSVQGQDNRKGAFISNSTFHGDVIGHQTILAPGLSPRDRDNRRRLLKHVRLSWIEGVLDQSLYREVLIALNLQIDPQAVGFSGPRLAIQRNQEAGALPSGTTIAQVYQQANQRLLILGAPGGGKTTLLLELARTLLEQALHDETRPMPVIFNLSSWTRQHLPLEEWLIQELRDQYNVARRIARQWLRDNHILPLLDGLDEVAETQRAACVASINCFIEEHGGEGLVVCSRSADYHAIGSKLLLDQAVQILLLDNEQIETYLHYGGAALAGVRAVLAKDAELHELARAPLLLNILSLAYQDQRPEELLGLQAAAQQRRLFDSYVQRMFERPARNDPKRYTRDQTLHWLRWLARRMDQNNQTVFQIELMQPWWLQSWQQRGLYILFATVGTMIIGATLGALFGTLFGALFNAALAVMRSSLPGDLAAKRPLLQENIDMVATMLEGGLILGLSAGLVGGFIICLIQCFQSKRNIWFSILSGISTSVIALVPWILIFLENYLIVLFFWGFWGTTFAITTAALIHRGSIQPTEAIRWNWQILKQRWLIGALCGLAGGLICGQCIGLYLGNLSHGLFFQIMMGLIVSVGFVPTFVITGALLSGITRVEIQSRSRPNQGIWQSLKISIINCLIFGLFIALFLGICTGIYLGLVYAALNGIINGLVFGVIIGILMAGILGIGTAVLIGIYSGGIAFSQHFALRAVCIIYRNIPWNYPGFLNYSGERLLLRRIGGSYIFIHRMLLDYFAEGKSAN